MGGRGKGRRGGWKGREGKEERKVETPPPSIPAYAPVTHVFTTRSLSCTVCGRLNATTPRVCELVEAVGLNSPSSQSSFTKRIKQHIVVDAELSFQCLSCHFCLSIATFLLVNSL